MNISYDQKPSYRTCFLCKRLVKEEGCTIIKIDGGLRNVCKDCSSKLESDQYTKWRRE